MQNLIGLITENGSRTGLISALYDLLTKLIGSDGERWFSELLKFLNQQPCWLGLRSAGFKKYRLPKGEADIGKLFPSLPDPRNYSTHCMVSEGEEEEWSQIRIARCMWVHVSEFMREEDGWDRGDNPLYFFAQKEQYDRESLVINAFDLTVTTNWSDKEAVLQVGADNQLHLLPILYAMRDQRKGEDGLLATKGSSVFYHKMKKTRPEQKTTLIRFTIWWDRFKEVWVVLRKQCDDYDPMTFPTGTRFLQFKWLSKDEGIQTESEEG